ALLDGPTLSFSKDHWIATTGTEMITVDGNTAPGWTGMPILAGQTVAMGTPSGARAYLAVRGGFDVPVVLGSRSTNLVSGFGGFHGRALVAGDSVTVGEHNLAGLPDGALKHPGPPVTSRLLVVRVVLGSDDFSRATLQVFLDSEFRMSPRSNHIGIRFDGPAIESRSRGDLISRPMPVGGVQVTPAGQPVVLLAARGTIGGYPLIATAISCDVWRLGQLRPGDSVRFEAVSVELGREISLEAYRELETQQPIAGR
ncbi:MAG TPA: biotin-dependent carboxyltransferase family protein, partial [Chloroflexota bacterium]|nr:biotin-dependent carboxyltransferase family protein [Chloroflexota bacterium]